MGYAYGLMVVGILLLVAFLQPGAFFGVLALFAVVFGLLYLADRNQGRN